MIEVASYPADLAAWDQDEHPLYFEVYGETEPQLDMTYGEALPAGGDSTQPVGPAAIYEYWWTLGHAGTALEHRHLWPERKADEPIWNRLDDPGARVYLYFPIDGGWRINELVATVKYLSPVADQKRWSEAAAGEWTRLQPLMEDAGTLASRLGVIPGIGTVASGAAPVLSTLAKLKLGSVPQDVEGFGWSIGKVTFGSKKLHGVMQGVMWTLPKEMFELLGGRLTGSVAVSFLPSRAQSSDPAASWKPQAAPLLGHAVVYADGGDTWVPGSSTFVELNLLPRVTDGAAVASPPPQPSAAAEPARQSE